MDKNKVILLGLLLLASLVTSQCNLPVRGSDDYSANIFIPLQGAVVGVGETVSVSGGVYDWLDQDLERINHLIYYANGEKIGEADVTYPPGQYANGATINWIPEASGEYFLQVYSSRRGNWSISGLHRVCVIDFSILSPDLSEIGVYYGTLGDSGECEFPERSPAAIPGSITFSVTALPDPLHYYPGMWDPIRSEYFFTVGEDIPEGCSDLPSLAFRASAGDPNDDVVMVKVDVSYDHGLNVFSLSLILTREGGTPLDPKIFTGESFPLRNYSVSEINQTFEVSWTAYAYDRSGVIVASDGPNIIPVEPCYIEEMVPLSAPSVPEAPDAVGYIPDVIQCYWGPGSPYTTVSSLKAGINVQIIGVGIEAGWLVVNNPIFEGVSCWVQESAVELPPELVLSGLPVINLPRSFGPGDSGGSERREGGGESSCNLSISACSNQGLSFDSENCQCVLIE